MTKTALITGTTSGIGTALCECFAKQQIHLVLVARSQQALHQQKKELQTKYPIAITILAIDLAKSDAAEQIVQQLADKKLQIDYLVNNAGFNEVGNFLETDLTKEIAMIQLHVVTVTKLIKLLLPGMVKKQTGCILTIASTGAYIPCPHNIVYTATKTYLLAFSRGLAADLHQTGVTVTTVCPGATKTNFAQKAGIANSKLFKRFVMDPKLVAEKSYRAMLAGKQVIIPGFYNKLLIATSKFLPNNLVNRISLSLLNE